MSEKDLRIDRMGLELDVPASILATAILYDRGDLLVSDNQPSLTTENSVPMPLMQTAERVRVRMLQMMEDTDKQASALITLFRKAPTHIQAHCRLNLIRLGKEKKIAPEQRSGYLRSFVDSYLDMILQLEHQVFKPRGVKEGMPDYIPDMFVDMGVDPTDNESERKWRKYLTNKKDLFGIHRNTLLDVLTRDMSKMEAIKRIAESVTSKRMYFEPLDVVTKHGAEFDALELDLLQMTLDTGARHDMGVGVCRHDVFDFQSLMQAVGVESRVLLCLSEWGRGEIYHNANIVRIDNLWHLVDITTEEEPFIHKLSNTFHPDKLKERSYRWQFGDNGHTRRYWTHDKAFNQIRDPDEAVGPRLHNDTLRKIHTIVAPAAARDSA